MTIKRTNDGKDLSISLIDTSTPETVFHSIADLIAILVILKIFLKILFVGKKKNKKK